MSRDGLAALPRGATGLSAVCDCGISRSYSLTNFGIHPYRFNCTYWNTISMDASFYPILPTEDLYVRCMGLEERMSEL